jgi:MOSC domain-containing protein
MLLSELNVYPIKSLKGVAVSESVVGKRGLEHDRRWVLVDANNRFISQREHPELATVSVKIEPEGLRVKSGPREPVMVPARPATEEQVTVQIWKDICQGIIVSNEADEWFSDVIGETCRLVYMPDDSERPVDPEYAVGAAIVSFADAYPFMLLSEASLSDLNNRLQRPVSMNRFRPNFVISGADAFAEDDWKLITIGNVGFHVVKPCARCVMTTVDQERGERNGDEPLQTLSGFRKRGSQVHFGQNLIAAVEGEKVRVGDNVTINSKGNDTKS